LRFPAFRSLAFAFSALLVLGALSSPVHAATTAKSKTAHHGKRRARKGAWKRHGQKKIDEQRAREIQEALIREKYLDGEPSGVWDARTKAAMTKFQDDHGWQTKVLPDSRALVALGLGPKYENLLNPESVDPASLPAGAPATAPAKAKPIESARNQR
jgi:peptidoglycan hydrolase-like protein with peptidoglycan-binding domain